MLKFQMHLPRFKIPRSFSASRQVITQKLFAPLKMTSVGFGAPGSKSEETRCICTSPYEYDEPLGHQQGKAYPGVDNPEAVRPAGGIHMSLKDSPGCLVGNGGMDLYS